MAPLRDQLEICVNLFRSDDAHWRAGAMNHPVGPAPGRRFTIDLPEILFLQNPPARFAAVDGRFGKRYRRVRLAICGEQSAEAGQHNAAHSPSTKRFRFHKRMKSIRTISITRGILLRNSGASRKHEQTTDSPTTAQFCNWPRVRFWFTTMAP